MWHVNNSRSRQQPSVKDPALCSWPSNGVEEWALCTGLRRGSWWPLRCGCPGSPLLCGHGRRVLGTWVRPFGHLKCHHCSNRNGRVISKQAEGRKMLEMWWASKRMSNVADHPLLHLVAGQPVLWKHFVVGHPLLWLFCSGSSAPLTFCSVSSASSRFCSGRSAYQQKWNMGTVSIFWCSSHVQKKKWWVAVRQMSRH